MNNCPIFSIIMPVYNVEKYLKDAVNSVLSQTFSDFELIMVDDCSPDNSPQICDGFAGSDDRINVIHLEKNGGISNARNIGIQAAHGNYLMFMDSDDYIEETLLNEVNSSLCENTASIVVFGMTEELYSADGKLVNSKNVSVPKKLFSNQAEIRKYVIELEKSTLYGYACNKFYNLAYLKNQGTIYHEYALLEDFFFNVEIFNEADKVNILNGAFYHYRKVLDLNSRTSKYVPEYFSLHYKKIQLLIEQQKAWGLYDDCNKKIIADIFSRYIFSAIERNSEKNSNMTGKDRRLWMSNLYGDIIITEILPYISTGFSLQGILNFCLKNKMIHTCLFLGHFICVVKQKMPSLFSVVKG